MNKVKLAKRLILLCCIIIVLTTIITSMSYIINTLITNQLALGQMANDDATFILMQTYQNTIKPVISIIYIVICIIVAITAISDIYKFIKNKNWREHNDEKK